MSGSASEITLLYRFPLDRASRSVLSYAPRNEDGFALTICLRRCRPRCDPTRRDTGARCVRIDVRRQIKQARAAGKQYLAR